MHSMAQIFSRAGLDVREVRMMTGIFAEVLKFAHLVRRGIIPDGLPPASVPQVSEQDMEAMRVHSDPPSLVQESAEDDES